MGENDGPGFFLPRGGGSGSMRGWAARLADELCRPGKRERTAGYYSTVLLDSDSSCDKIYMIYKQAYAFENCS